MFELATSYAIYMAIFLSIMAIVKYISYKSSIRDVHTSFQEFSEKHEGHLEKGSFLVPPFVEFEATKESKIKVTLRSFYLYRGRRGNYTELSFKLPARNYLNSFTLTLDNPDLDEKSQWTASITEPMTTAENHYNSLTTMLTEICDMFSADHLKCRFDGEGLSIRVLELIDKAEDIDKFYCQSYAAFLETLRITKSELNH